VEAAKNHSAFRLSVSFDVLERECGIVRRAKSDLGGATLRLLERQVFVEDEIRKHQGTHAIRRLAVHEYRTIQRVANEVAKYIELPITERLVADRQWQVTEPGASDLAHLIVPARLTRLAEIDDGFEA
jgi:hypothetical protein